MKTPETVDRLAGVRLLVVGDAMLDHYVVGRFDRISPEAPVGVLDVEREFDRVGGAGNAAANAVSLGGEVSLLYLCGRTAGELDAEHLAQKCRQLGIRPLSLPGLPRTIRKSRMMARGQQLLRVDWDHHFGRSEDEQSEANRLGMPWEPLPLCEDILAARRDQLSGLLPEINAVLVSDYAKGMVDADLMALLTGSGKPVIVDPRPQHMDLYEGVHLVTPNRSEALRMLGLSTGHTLPDEDVAQRLANRLHCQVLLTLGADGMLLCSRSGALFRLPALAQEVFDPTGAGDTVAACMAMGIAAGLPAEDAMRLANTAAGEVVRHIGTVPVSLDDLRTSIAAGAHEET